MSNSPQSSIADLFETGNYATVAMHGSKEDWHTYAALGLIGKTEAAIEGLRHFDQEEATFYRAVAHWIGGEDDRAIQLLQPLSTPHAQNLLTLIRKPHIDVLAQLPWSRAGSWDLLTASANDPKFRVRNISFHPDDLPNQPYADIHSFYDPLFPPDFYVCQMVEWHFIPPNLQELGCPLFGQTADYDLHIQAVYPWLQLFDHLLVTDQTEWQDVIRLVKVPVATFPKSFALPDSLPPIPRRPREFDLFLSGTVTHPYHPDKAELLHQILRISDLKSQIVNGFQAELDYYRNLLNTKVCFTYVRHPTALPTRGLEALSMGCAVVVQRDSVLTLFTGAEQGVLTYELEAEDLAPTIRQILRYWPEYEYLARQGAEIIRREFSASRVASQYLRFLTVLAAKPRSPRLMQPTEQFLQKRTILQKGWLPSYDFGHSPVLRQIGIANQERLQTLLEISPPSSRPFIDLARESVLYNYHRALNQDIPVADWLAGLTKTYQAGMAQFPRSLVLRFNFMRVALHFGTPALVSDTLDLLDETLNHPPSHWEIDRMEDVFPWDFCGCFFNYRAYFDQLTASFCQGIQVDQSLIQLIRASLHYYRGFYRPYQGYYFESTDDFREAVTLDPAFPYYQFRYAQDLIQRGLPEDYEKAGHLLVTLIKHSILFQEAFALLSLLQDKELYHCPEFKALAEVVQRGQRVRYTENIPEAPLRASLDQRELPLKRLHFEVPPLAVPEAVIQEAVDQLTQSILPGSASQSPSLQQVEKIKQELKQTRDALIKTQAALSVYQSRIQAMETSKFWQLRKAWFRLKRVARLPVEDDWKDEFSDK